MKRAHIPTYARTQFYFFIFFIIIIEYNYIFYTQSNNLKKHILHNITKVIATKSAASPSPNGPAATRLSRQMPAQSGNHLGIR